MRVQIWMSEDFKQTPVDYLEKLGGKYYNLAKRHGCNTMEDVVNKFSELKQVKGFGEKSGKILTDAIVNLMIETLPKEQRRDWFLNLVESNEVEDLMNIAEGFREKIEEVA